MLLFAVLTLSLPALAQENPAHLSDRDLPTVEPIRLEIRSGRLGGVGSAIAFTYAPADAARNAPKIRFEATFVDPRANTRSQSATDSIACPEAATILRAVPASATAASELPDRPLFIVLHDNTYTLSGRLNYPGRSPGDFAMAGRSQTPLGWWSQALVAALNSCWPDRP